MITSIRIILIISFILPSFGVYSWLSIRRQQIHADIESRIHEGVDASHLVVFRFSKTEAKNLKWEHPREFELNGEMYDVVTAITLADAMIYKCIADNEESELNKKLKILTKENSKNPTEKEENSEGTADLYFFELLSSFALQFDREEPQQLSFKSGFQAYLPPAMTLVAPPPEII